MQLTENSIKQLEKEEFVQLLDIIGEQELRNNLISLASKLPKTSIYYRSPKVEGSFWKGFRKERILISKVKKFYLEEVYQSTSKFNLLENFTNLLLKSLNVDEENVLESFMSFSNGIYCELLCKIFDISLDDNTSKFLLEKREMRENYEKKILRLELEKKEISDNCRKQISKLELQHSKEIEQISIENSKMFAEKNNYVESLKQQVLKYEESLTQIQIEYNEIKSLYEEYDAQVIKKIIAENMINEGTLKKSIDNLNIKNKQHLISIFNRINEKTQILEDCSNLKMCKNHILVDYILLCLLEENLVC